MLLASIQYSPSTLIASTWNYDNTRVLLVVVLVRGSLWILFKLPTTKNKFAWWENIDPLRIKAKYRCPTITATTSTMLVHLWWSILRLINKRLCCVASNQKGTGKPSRNELARKVSLFIVDTVRNLIWLYLLKHHRHHTSLNKTDKLSWEPITVVKQET